MERVDSEEVVLVVLFSGLMQPVTVAWVASSLVDIGPKS